MLSVELLTKIYGRSPVLEGLSLTAPSGSVTGIAGPNGAGKSTLVKILAGETEATSGRVILDGIARSRVELSRLTAVVHQEPQLFPTLTVAENLAVGHETEPVRRPRLSRSHRALLSELGILAHADRPVGMLPIAVQQRTEIARALARDARVFLFDEPNSALTEPESAALFSQMAELADRGHVVLFVSHRLHELVAVASTVLLIRDGRCTGAVSDVELTESRLARELALASSAAPPDDRAGDRVTALLPAQQAPSAGGLGLVRWQHAGRSFTVRDLVVRPGEVVAVLGVEGSGGREFVRSLAGFEAVESSASFSWHGVSGGPSSVSAFVPASRQDSAFLDLSVAECLIARLPRREVSGRLGLLARGRSRHRADALIAAYAVRCEGPDQRLGELSGGNQQKVVLASAVAAQPLLLAVEEPTRGVDVGSRAEIYRLLQEFAGAGRVAIVFCTEVTEVYEAADRCLVFAQGQLVGDIDVRAIDGLPELVDLVASLEAGSSAATSTGRQ